MDLQLIFLIILALFKFREDISDEKALDYAATLGAKDCLIMRIFAGLLLSKEILQSKK